MIQDAVPGVREFSTDRKEGLVAMAAPEDYLAIQSLGPPISRRC
jgi:hypothetical protein